MADVHSWHNHTDARNVVRQAVEALETGRLVVFPTDTGYVLAADARQPDAAARLRSLDLSPESPLALGLRGPAHAIEVLPELGPLARRLTRRCWPGPVTLLHGDISTSLADALNGARDREGWLWVRSPAHSAILHSMQQLNAPLLLGVPRRFSSRGNDVETVLQSLGNEVAVAIEDGPCLYPDGPTVVAVKGDQWEVVREGVIPASQIKLQLASLIVFVCTGNTCRSPLAEALCKKRLADGLGCAIDELPERGFIVLSAGLAAYPGDPAATPALGIASEYGADLCEHQSRPLNPELAVQADHLICMTQAHLQALVHQFPYLGCEPRLLNAEGQDLADPVGQAEEVYRSCAARIWDDLNSVVCGLLPSSNRKEAG